MARRSRRSSPGVARAQLFVELVFRRDLACCADAGQGSGHWTAHELAPGPLSSPVVAGRPLGTGTDPCKGAVPPELSSVLAIAALSSAPAGVALAMVLAF